MKKKEIIILTYDEIFTIFRKIDELKESILEKENELHGKILKNVDSNIFNPVTLNVLLENDRFNDYAAEAKRELLNVSIELENIFANFFHNKNDNTVTAISNRVH